MPYPRPLSNVGWPKHPCWHCPSSRFQDLESSERCHLLGSMARFEVPGIVDGSVEVVAIAVHEAVDRGRPADQRQRA